MEIEDRTQEGGMRMKDADLLSHLEYIGREYLDDRERGWMWAMMEDETCWILYVPELLGSSGQAPTLQEAVDTLIEALYRRRPIEGSILAFYASDVLFDGPRFRKFIESHRPDFRGIPNDSNRFRGFVLDPIKKGATTR